MVTTAPASLDSLIREQSTGVGGSEVMHVLGLEPYGCAEQLRYKKSGAKPDFPFNGNKHTRRGVMFEDFVADAYEEETHRKVARTPGWEDGTAKRDRDYPFLLCHSDRQIFNATGLTLHNGTVIEPGRPGLLSIKAPGEWMMRKLIQDLEMPFGYIAQLQYELAVWRRSWGSYAFGGIVDDEFRIVHFDVVYNEQIAEDIRSQVKLWWVRFQQGETFGKLPEDDRRCESCQWRTTCQGDQVLKLHERMLGATEEGSAIALDADPEWQELFQLRKERDETLKLAEELRDKVSTEIAAKMGERLAIQTVAGKVYYKPQVRYSLQDKPLLEVISNLAVNTKAVLTSEDATSVERQLAIANVLQMAATLPELVAEKFVNRSAFRSLRLYPGTPKAAKAKVSQL